MAKGITNIPFRGRCCEVNFPTEGRRGADRKRLKVDLPADRVAELVRTSLANETVSCAGDEETIISPVRTCALQLMMSMSGLKVGQISWSL